MKTLKQLTLENKIDDENLLYKVDSWFENSLNERQSAFKKFFYSMVASCQKHKFVDFKSIELAIEHGTTNELEIRCVVDFVCDNINRQCDDKEEINYLYTFKKIIQLVASYTN